MRLPGLSLGVPLLLLQAAVPAENTNQAPGPPVFGIGVTLVAVPVFVTDKSGRAVSGLAAEDFEIIDGGQPVPVVAFQAVDVEAPARPAAAGGAATAAADERSVAVQAAAARQFLLLFDLQFSPPHGLLKARKAAARFVEESLSPSDLVAVATYGRTGIKMLTNFTGDRAHVARAIDRLGLLPAVEGGADPLDLGGAFQGDTSGNPIIDTGSARLDEELAAEADLMREGLKREYLNKVMDFLGALEQLGKALSSLGGRKQIVLLSGGFNDAAWQDLKEATWQDAGKYREQPLSVRKRMADLFGEAGRADVVIHTIDVGGLAPPTTTDLTAISPGPPGLPGSSWDRRPNPGRGTLAALADNTGGRFVLPTNDFSRALEEVDEVSHQYYVLAFQPAEPAAKPGAARSLQVRVHRSGLKVSHRTAYVLPTSASPASPAAQRLAAAEAVAKGLSGGPLRLHLEALPYRDRQHGPSLPAVLHVDGDGLATPGQGQRLDVVVYGYAMAQGRVLDRLSLSVSLDLSQQGAALKRGGLDVVTAFAVPTGALDLRFFVRAGQSGLTGSIRQAVEVPAFVEDRLALSPPMLTLPLEGRVVARGISQGGPQLELPFRLGSDPFVPQAITLPARQPRELCVFVWPAGDRLEVAGEIERPGAGALPLRVEGVPRVVRDRDGFDRYLVTVVAPEAPAGAYVLRLTLREPGTTRSARSETEIRLED